MYNDLIRWRKPNRNAKRTFDAADWETLLFFTTEIQILVSGLWNRVTSYVGNRPSAETHTVYAYAENEANIHFSKTWHVSSQINISSSRSQYESIGHEYFLILEIN